MPRLLAVALACLATPAAGQDSARGAELFEQWCARCHGADATGGGPLAALVTVEPADLTRLQARAGGAFPVYEVARRIDGRDPVVGHGSPMPVYGEMFEGAAVAIPDAGGQPVIMGEAVADLIAWLREVQG